MTLTDSSLLKEVKHSYTLDIGDLHFFDNFIVAEFSQGLDLSMEKFKEGSDLFLKHFNTDIPFGLVVNRVNSYSINPIDISKLENVFKNLVAVAVVTYTSITKISFEIEDQFFSIKRKRFESLEEASHWVKEDLEQY